MTIAELKENCKETLRYERLLAKRGMIAPLEGIEKHELILKLIEEHEEHEKDKGLVQIDLAAVVNQSYVKSDVLDKIKAEILENAFSVVNPKNTYEYTNVLDLGSIEKIIDKYKAESEG